MQRPCVAVSRAERVMMRRQLQRRAGRVRWMSAEIQLPSAEPRAESSGAPAASADSASTGSASGTSIALSNHPRAQAYSNHDRPKQSDLPMPPQTTHPKPRPVYSTLNPPFHTHTFFAALEKSFPTPVARALMRATRALLIDKVGKAREDGLGKKDLENQAYLFRAALTELRNDTALRIRNQTSGIHTSMAASRRELDSLSARMKEALDTLRHENQMEVDNRKNEARADLKQQTLVIENVTSKAMIQLGDLRTEMERLKWMSLYRSIMSLLAFGAMIVIFMEINRSSKPKGSSQSKAAATPPLPLPVDDLKRSESGGGLEDSNYVT